MSEIDNIESVFTHDEKNLFRNRYKDLGAGFYDLEYDISAEAEILSQKSQAHIDAIEKLKVINFVPKGIYHYQDLMRWCHVHNSKAKGSNPIRDPESEVNIFLFTQLIIKDQVFEHAVKDNGSLMGVRLYQIARNVQLPLL